MTRGEIWSSASSTAYGGKPRPVVIIQHRYFESLDSVTFCGFTRDQTDLPLFRIAINPSPLNGLEHPSRIMVDKILTTPKARLGYRIGELDAADIARLNQALAMFLGLVG
ncbi:MAG: type II toxin-antitoxin system PemK/MazF family toxin [Pseudolabrys sp.]|nr:type II toxin-antitoxin system PemK/MazF family toxin [Pseudolabrys sp.]